MGIVYLTMLVACGAGLTLSCKWANRKGSSALGLATVVQLDCFLVLLAMSLAQGRMCPRGLLLLGVGAGIGGAVGFLLTLRALQVGHYAFTNAIVGACFLASVLFSAIFWEHIGWLSLGGIVVVTTAVALIAFSGAGDGGETPGGWGKWAMLVAGAFLLQGLSQICNAATARQYAPAQPPLLEFMTVIYGVGTLVLLPVNLRKGEFSPRTLLFGSLGAAASLLGTVFLLGALRLLPVSIVFPLAVSCGLLAAVLLSRLLFKEKIGRLGYVGIAVEVVGVVLLALAMAQSPSG